MDWWAWLLLIIAAIYIFNRHQNKKLAERREYLLTKYNDKVIVEMIMKKQFWQGQTEEQLLDSLGRPLDIDQKVLKTKVKETWKYDSTGKNRYALKIIIENGQVTGWDKK